MLKHGFAALMILHDAETPLCSTDYFSVAETPRCSTVHFSNAETPLKNTGDCSPTPKHLCSTLFTSSQSQKHPIPPSFSLPKQLRPALVSFFLPLPFLQHHSQQLFLLTETQIVSDFSSVSPMLKHHCSAFFIPFHHLFHPLIDETIPSSNCFVSLLKHYHSAHHSSMLLKHHFPATFRHSSSMLKHPPSAPSNSSPILKHQFSAVLHHNFSIFLCCCDTRSPSTVQIAGRDMIKRQPTKQQHHEREPNLVGRTNQMVRQRYVNIMSNN
jgi:hypothetical protein